MRLPCFLFMLISSIATAHPLEADHGTPRIPSAVPPGIITSSGPNLLVPAGPIAGRGNRFTQKQKAILKERNAAANEGKVLCEKCNAETVPAEKHEKSVTPPKNEAHTDHKIPRAKGGQADLDNGQILCRDCNLKKSDKTE